MIDVKKYLGIPFKWNGRDSSGCDCFGLITLVLEENFGISISTDFEIDKESYPIVLKEQIGTGHWKEVGSPSVGDIVLLRFFGLPCHCGIVVSPTMMLHTLERVGAVCERFKSPIWRSKIEGFLRYEA